ncbi:sensor histidine kinase [Streptomyces griseiscabiei]|uniref:sensor histidine kinase n=1 Tax=Streptomyces griseiscabiei TaxID=2993540 RepID=UPI003873C93C
MRGDGIRGVRAWWARGRVLAGGHPWVVDAGVALLVQGAMTMPFVVPRAAGLAPATWAAYGLTTLTVVPLVWRRRAPFAVLLAVLVTSMVYKLALDGPGQPLPYNGLVVVYTIAVLSPPWVRLVSGVLVSVAVPVGVWLNTRSARELTFSAFVFAAAYVFGRLTDARQRAHLVEAERAAARERARIAREMHDVVAHRVSLMVVHAAALQAVARKDPEKAVRNAALVGDMGRQALTELREMLGVLRSGEGFSSMARVDAVSGPAPVPLAAVGAAAAAAASRAEDEAGEGPRLTELEVLVGQSAAAGMVVELSVEGEVRVYAAEVEQTAYRVVQEALTNVHKHAAGAKTQVRLAHRTAEIAMQVENGAPPEPGAAGAVRLPSGGNGLLGMKERVAELGGVFVSGPTDAGGFRVSAVIPAA